MRNLNFQWTFILSRKKVERLTKLLFGFPSIQVPKENTKDNFFWWPKGRNFGFDNMKNGYFTETEINSLLQSEGSSFEGIRRTEL